MKATIKRRRTKVEIQEAKEAQANQAELFKNIVEQNKLLAHQN